MNERFVEDSIGPNGERSDVLTVDRDPTDLGDHAKALRILELADSGLWDGNLEEMRRDAPTAPRRRQRS